MSVHALPTTCERCNGAPLPKVPTHVAPAGIVCDGCVYELAVIGARIEAALQEEPESGVPADVVTITRRPR